MSDPVAPPPPPATRESVLGLLQSFSRQPGCERYVADSKKIDLVLTYLWLRQFAEGLPFEVFLAKFAAVADFDDMNLKYPEAALKHHCPRSKKGAEDAGVDQWSAKECTEILSIYVDMAREAEAQAVEIPLSLADYLAMDGPNYKAGTVAIERPPKAPRATRTQRTTAATEPSPADPNTGLVPTDVALRPTEPQQRIIYAVPGQGDRQIKGVTESIKEQHAGGEIRQYVTFVTDEGERFEDKAIIHCTVVDEPPPPQRADVTETKKIWIPKAQHPQLTGALALTTAMGNVAAGDVIFRFPATFDCALGVDINVINGETGPYVEAQLYEPGNDDLLETLPPRQNILGEYRFETSKGVLVVEVCTRE